MRRALSALAVALLVTLSVLGGVAGVAGAQSNGAPSEMAGVPSEHVGPPDRAQNGQGGPPSALSLPENVPTHAAAWDVHSERHADDLEVTVGELGDRFALVFSDDQNHAGRAVAVNASTLETAVGDRPSVAYVEHESGHRYSVPVRYHNDYAVLRLHEFSSNTVTFESEVSITGEPAAHGAQYSYEMDDAASAANYSIQVTGSTVEEWANATAAGIADGDSVSVSASGTSDPIGPASGDPEVTVASHRIHGTTGYTTTGTVIDDSSTVTVDPAGVPSGTVNRMAVRSKFDQDSTYNVSINGEQVATDASISSEGWNWFAVDETTLDGSQSVDVTITHSSGSNLDFNQAGENGTGYPAVQFEGQPDSATVSADDGISQTFNSLTDGQTVTSNLPLSSDATQLDLSLNGGGRYDLDVAMQQVVETTDPTIEVNGNTTSHSGTLADGSSTSLSTDTSWIENGTNRVNVSLTTVSGAPTPQVGLTYSHDSTERQTTDYTGETWSERYNISRTFDTDRNAASLTIPFTSDRVVGIRDVEQRVDGGSWQSVEQYSLDGSELTIELGAIQAGETHAVRATGTKVKPVNGSITVLEPTTEGNTLNSKVRVDTAQSGFAIDVSGTDPIPLVHYTVDETWTGNPYASVEANGDQTLMLSPSDGDTFRVRTLPLQATPESGSVSVIIRDHQEPRFSLQDHSADVNVTWRNTVSGDTYALRDVSTGDEVARDTAESPVSFLAPSGAATYVIETVSASGGGDPPVASTASSGPLSTLSIFVGLAGSIAGFVVLGRRLGARGWRQNLGLVAGGGLVGVVALEAVTAGSLLGQLAQGLGALAGGALGGFIQSGAGAVASGIGMFWAVYAVYERFDLPPWMLIISGLGIGVFVLENVTNGALGSGLSQVSPLLWLGLVFGGLALLWRVLQPRPIQITGGEQ